MNTPILRTFLVSTVLSLLTLPALADPQAQVDLAKSALNAGNEKIAIYAVSGSGMPDQLRIEAGQLSAARGYTVNGEGAIVGKGLTWSPVISYDPDINGGSHKSSFNVSGFEFSIPENQRRKSGVVIGAETDAFLRYGFGNQTILDLSGSAYLVWAPQHDIMKANLGGSACVTRQIERDLYLSGCMIAAMSETDLSSEAFGSARVSVNKILEFGTYTHDVRATLSENYVCDRVEDEGYAQTRVEIAGTGISPDNHVFGYAVTLGETVQGEKVRTQSYAGFRSFETFAGSVTVGAEYAVYEGARWLGQDVNEDSVSVFADLPVHERLDVRVKVEKTRSGSPLNAGNQVSFLVDIKF